jgi:hypothetical protein
MLAGGEGKGGVTIVGRISYIISITSTPYKGGHWQTFTWLPKVYSVLCMGEDTTGGTYPRLAPSATPGNNLDIPSGPIPRDDAQLQRMRNLVWACTPLDGSGFDRIAGPSPKENGRLSSQDAGWNESMTE